MLTNGNGETIYNPDAYFKAVAEDRYGYSSYNNGFKDGFDYGYTEGYSDGYSDAVDDYSCWDGGDSDWQSVTTYKE